MNNEKQQVVELALVSQKDLSLVENNSLNGQQLKQLLKKTPKQYVKTRPAKGGGTWNYVSGGYVKKCLNLMFGWDWDFEIVSEQITAGEVIVKGRLTCRTNGHQIVKMQYGNKDIIYRKAAPGEERQPLSIGNDMKAAATDALKKCAAEIGIAADIYNADDFREINVLVTDDEQARNNLADLLELKRDNLSTEDMAYAERIINNTEVKSFGKLHTLLMSK